MTAVRGPSAESWNVVPAPAAELDLAMAPQLHTLLRSACRPGVTIALDVRDVTFMDSSALAVVLSVHRTLLATGGGLVLLSAQPRVLRVLRLCGLVDLLEHAGDGSAGPSRAGVHSCRRRAVHRPRRRS